MPIKNNQIQNSSEGIRDNEQNNQSLICKDGFCFLPGKEDNKNLENKNITIFDPV